MQKYYFMPSSVISRIVVDFDKEMGGNDVFL